MTPAHEAAAFHGLAENQSINLRDRLASALKALEFYTAPHRGDAVAVWIKGHRDEAWQSTTEGSEARGNILDYLLDDYRLHADTGTPLDEDVVDGPGEPLENGDPNG